MGLRLQIVAAVLALCSVPSCSPEAPESSSDGTWVGTISTDGNVTTVINESGSVWGGTARLEEELSIGVDDGADEYMFGYINSFYVSDERIALLDAQASIVRMYTNDGDFLFVVGRSGQGPGEYSGPMILTINARGHTFVFDISNYRLTEFGQTGEYLKSFQVPGFACCSLPMHPQSPGLLWLPLREIDPEIGERDGVQLFSTETGQWVGQPTWVPEIEFEATTYRVEGNDIRTPFSPRIFWQLTPAGGLVVGANDRYRFELLTSDGTKTVVQRYWDPVPIDPDEREWHRRRVVASRRARLDGFGWNGDEMPRHRGAFSWLNAAVSGEIWIGREIGSRRIANCTEDPLEQPAASGSPQPCFEPLYVIDVFDADGRYMGEVEMPPNLRPSLLYINADTVVSGFVEDERGTVQMKRYRLVLPGGER